MPRRYFKNYCSFNYVIDEIGKMELLSPKFRTKAIDLLAQPSNILATIAKKGKGFIEQIKARNDIELIEVTRENRDQLFVEIAKRISGELGRSATTEAHQAGFGTSPTAPGTTAPYLAQWCECEQSAGPGATARFLEALS
jgi:hypothetical protein